MTTTIDPSATASDIVTADPRVLAALWIDRAREGGSPTADSCSLTTVDADGTLRSRIVRALDLDERGMLFTSHTDSRKGRSAEADGRASACFWWPERSAQLSISGTLERTDDDESDMLWHSRDPALHAMSVASHQSSPLLDEDALRARAAQLTGRQPRPRRFSGYRLVPVDIEFWESAPDRLYRRVVHRLTDDGWTATRLQP